MKYRFGAKTKLSLLMGFSFLSMIGTYLVVFGAYKTINMILDEYILILCIIPLSLILLNLKIKLRGKKIIDFTKNSQISLKATILFFLVFQVVDYYYNGGFVGMISQWFLYWMMAMISIFLINIINYYKNYRIQVKLRYS